MNPFPITGYKAPQTPDPRNYKLEAAQPVAPYPTAYSTDLSALGVFDQHFISDCVENATTKAHQYYLYKNTNTVLNLCRRFLAYWTVQLDGFPLTDGTSVENALKEAKKRGICLSTYFLDDHTLDSLTFSTTVPSAQATADGATRTVASYAFLSQINEQTLKSAIHQNGVVIAGMKLDHNWWTAQSGAISWAASDLFTNNGNLRLPTDKASTGGHCVLLVGYTPTSIIFLNSFGDTWGRTGYGSLGLDYLPYFMEAATIVDLTPEQVQKAQQATQIVNTINQLQNVETPQNTALISQIIASLWSKFLAIFQ